MSKTNRQFKGKSYRQGHEPAELELTRIRRERKMHEYSQAYGGAIPANKEIELALREAAQEEQRQTWE